MPPGGWWSEAGPARTRDLSGLCLSDKRRGYETRWAFEAVSVYNTYNVYNWLYNLYNYWTTFEFVLGPRLIGSDGTGSARRVAVGRPPPGGPVRSTGKNTRSSRDTSALWAFVQYGKNDTVPCYRTAARRRAAATVTMAGGAAKLVKWQLISRWPLPTQIGHRRQTL